MPGPIASRPLRLLVLGASGRTGREVVSAARRRGHEVTALVRRRTPREIAGVTYAIGDPLSAADLSKCAGDAEIVLSCLGQTSSAAPHLLGDAAKAAASAGLRERRYIVISQGLLFASPNPLIFMLRLALRRVTEDSRAMEAVVTTSDLNWTIVRPPRLVDGAPARPFVALKDHRPPGLSMRRSELAAFLIEECETPRFVRAIVGVASA